MNEAAQRASENDRAALHSELRRAARQHTGIDVLRWAVTRRRQKWPKWVEIAAGEAPPERVAGEPRCTVVNHSTVLLQFDGWNVLTDPIWSKRCSPSQRFGPRRVHAPALAFDDLPPIDLVLLSHDHYDHCDEATIRRLARRRAGDATRWLTGRGMSGLLQRWGVAAPRILECDWWQQAELEPATSESPALRCTFLPVQHFSGRGLRDRNRVLPGAFALHHQATAGRDPNRCVVYGADTGYSEGLFPAWKEALPPIDLALLPIGAYLPRWFMGPVHMDPADAVRAHRELDPGQSIAVHWGTFQLTDEAREAPRHELALALDDQGVDPAEFLCLDFGVPWTAGSWTTGRTAGS